MESKNRKFWGIVLVVVGIVFLLDRLNIIPVDIFFAGWWTLFLIIPAIYMMFKQGIQIGNVILLGLGIYFFLNERNWGYSYLILPAALIILGIAIIIRKR
ncbi:MAG: DUF5668 domain-containing protein [Candidatus Izemoplasmatales bacterium]|jgi:hypothetical protein|nr:DUF5668 domain-containing protein [Candidatus Izemoplasmatales bacterium]